jgi:hypothetical protein
MPLHAEVLCVDRTLILLTEAAQLLQIPYSLSLTHYTIISRSLAYPIMLLMTSF